MTLKDELIRMVDAHNSIGADWRNSSRKNEETYPKQKTCPVVDVCGGEIKSDAIKNNIA